MWRLWKRNSDDALTKLFFERYGLQLLRHPREDVNVADVYAVSDGHVQRPGALSEFVQPAPPLPPVRAGEAMADLAGTVSSTFDAELSLNYLGGFLAAFGAPDVVGKIGAEAKRHKASGIRFRFAGATRDYVDPFALERSLRKHKLHRNELLFRADHRYYLVLGVARSDSIAFTLADEAGGSVGLEADALKIADVKSRVKLERSAGHEVTAAGPKKLAFAVELSEITYNEDRNRLETNAARDLIRVLGSDWAKAASADALAMVRYDLIDDPDDSVFLPED